MKLNIFGKLALAPLFAIAMSASPASAEWKPENPIKIVIPYGAGGSTDTFGRVFANAMEKQTGWTVIVENRPGAGGVIGQLEVNRAAPDGHTIGLSNTSLFAIHPYLPASTGELETDSADFMGTLSAIPYAIVAASNAPFDDLASLAEYSKANGPVKFSATAPELTYTLQKIADDFGFEFVAAQTSGSGESLQLVAGRHADITISGGVHVAYVLDGRMKVIAHLLDERADYAPDRPTVAELGGELPLRNFFMFNAPKGLPADVKQALADAIDDAVNSEAVQAHAKKIHVRLHNLGPDGSAQEVMTEAEKWKAILAD